VGRGMSCVLGTVPLEGVKPALITLFTLLPRRRVLGNPKSQKLPQTPDLR
jgi:hypothetical protein